LPYGIAERGSWLEGIMGATGSGGVPGGYDAGFQTVLALAEALRAEFGADIDAHPGGTGSEAGSVNRAFRAAARVVVGGQITSGDDVGLMVGGVLRQVALRRLVDAGVDDKQAGAILDAEPLLGDRWLVYLSLAPESVIAELIK
jgi:hypothetical protein